MTALPTTIAARAWKFGDDINTDLMLPGPVMTKPEAEQARAVFRANRPGWAAQVRPGDILVAGRNFGMGSGRPAALAMRDLGLAAVLAESVNGLFFRNCVNYALPVLAIVGIRALFDEGDEAEIDFGNARVTHLRSGAVLCGAPWPEMLQASLRHGGLVEKLEAQGLLHPAGWTPQAEAGPGQTA